MKNFDETLSLNIKELNLLEDELVLLGFKKYKTSEKYFIFKYNPKYSNRIEKIINDNYIYYTLYENDESWESEKILTIFFHPETNDISKIEDNRKFIYSKYFNNEIRKHKIKNLFELDIDGME